MWRKENRKRPDWLNNKMRLKLPSVAKKPYLYFWTVAGIILLTGAVNQLQDPDGVIDINLHETYYVIGHIWFTVLFTSLFVYGGFLYWGLRRVKLVKLLTRLHTIISVGGVVIYWPVVKLLGLTDSLFSDRATVGAAVIVSAVLLVQSLFILNILIAPFRGKMGGRVY